VLQIIRTCSQVYGIDILDNYYFRVYFRRLNLRRVRRELLFNMRTSFTKENTYIIIIVIIIITIIKAL